jgi:hypothetical protein
VPSCVREYSTAIAFDAVTRLATSPVDSRLRRVLVSMRCETLPRRRRNSPCRRGLSLSENKICGVHLPMKMGGETFDPGIVFVVFCLLRKISGVTTFEFASHTFLRARHRPSLPVLARRAQLGTYVYPCGLTQRSLHFAARRLRTGALAP